MVDTLAMFTFVLLCAGEPQRNSALISRESYYGRAHFKLETFSSYAITTVHIDHTTCAIIYATAKYRYFLCLLILRR